MERKGAHGVGGQLHCVQQGHLDEAVGLGATGWPVLIALHLQRDSRAGCKGVWRYPKAQAGRSRVGGLALSPELSDPLCHPSPNPIMVSRYASTPALTRGTRDVIENCLFMTRFHQARFLPNLPITFMHHFQAL